MEKNKQHYYSEILKIGFPVVVGQLGTIILGFADTLMIGHHSTQELAAAGFVNNIFNLILLFYLGFSYGLTPIVGKLYGMERKNKIGQKVRNSLLANMLIGLALVVLMVILYFNLARIGQPEELLPMMKAYLLVLIVSIPFVGVFNTFKQLFDGVMRTQIPMWVMLAGNIVNILFNWLLIYGVGPFPELGLLGAGLSTMGSRVFMAIALFAILLIKGKYRVYRDGLLHGHINKVDFVEMNHLGFPVALQLGMETAAFGLSAIMVGWLGTIPLAAHQVMITISQLFYLVLAGLSSAVAIRISLFAGQRDYKAVKTNAADGFRLVLLSSAITAVPVLFFRHYIGGLFTSDIEVQQAVAMLIIVLVIYQFGDGLQCVYANALRGIACVKPMVYIAFLAYFIISLPLGYFLAFPIGLHILGIWMAFPIGLTIAGFLYWRRFNKELVKLQDSAPSL